MTQACITTEIHNHILVIRLNRPEAKNAITLSMYQALTDALMQFEQSEELRVAVLTGGLECFSAGNDLNDFLAGEELNENHPATRFLYQLANVKKPLMAAVAGPAIGIGTTILLHCDLVYAADSAMFQLPFTRLGLCPEAGASVLLPQLAGHKKAFEYLVLGDAFDARQAEQIGLVNQVCSGDELQTMARQKAEQLALLPQQAVLSSKALLKKQNQTIIDDVIKTELAQFAQLLASDECRQRVSRILSR